MPSKKVIRKEQCPECAKVGQDNAKDNLAIYEDGGSYCFACSETRDQGWALQGEVKDLPKRLITKETCQFANYQVGKYTGFIHGKGNVKDEPVQIANYYGKKRKLLRQKLRTKDKDMTLLGPKTNDLPLYGQWLWEPNPNVFVTIVEGEIDMLTVLQVQGHQYPVVSLPNGAQSVVSALKKAAKWLMGWKHIVLAFDNDEAGVEAQVKAQETDLFDPTLLKLATWPLKDANEMLLAGRGNEITQVLFNAKSDKPNNLVTISDIYDKVLEQPKFGTDYPFKSMTQITYGHQLGEIHIIVAANGIGKTEFIKELMFHFLDQGLEIGLFSFEQTPADTMRRLIGAKLGHKLHLPGSDWPLEDIKRELKNFDDKIYLCDRTGSIKLDELFLNIKYLAKACNKKLFFIDNIRGLGIGHDVEAAGTFMRKLQALVNELQVSVYLLSHVAKDKLGKQVYVSTSPKNAESYTNMSSEETQALIEKPGMNWETGRMPTTENVDGPSVICDLANYVWGLARNKTSEDYDENHTIKVKAIKTRLDGEYTGKSFNLYYTKEGRLIETDGIKSNEPVDISQLKGDF